MNADVILLPVHNRRAVTLAALRRLAEDRVTEWASVLVIDDGSTDETARAIQQEHPGVEILRGDGQWWWGGAMRRGMEWAAARRAERIYWLNDDCAPPPGGLRQLHDTLVADPASVRWIEALTPSGWSYGGHKKTPFRIRRCTPDEERAGIVDTFSGNCVGFASLWVRRVGLPDDTRFPHALADLDYGLRLRNAGARLRRLDGLVATSEEPPAAASERWTTSRRPMREIWRGFSSVRSPLHFSSWRRFALRHWGFLWGPVVFVTPYVRWALIALVRPFVSNRG